jgi:methionyl-tRNA formyltransferase
MNEHTKKGKTHKLDLLYPDIKFVFFGSFRVSADILEGMIKDGLKPALVVCSPDRPAGRKKIMTAPAVKKMLAENAWDIPIAQPEKPTDILDKLGTIRADVFVIMGYPHIIPQSIIDIPRLGTIGVHPSLLPKYRGASPMQSALLAGETETGVTLYVIDEKVDHGPIIATVSVPIASDETNLTLEKKCAQAAAQLLIETLPKFAAGKITPTEQAHAQATMTKKFTSEDGRVDMIHDTPKTIFKKIQAFNPEPSVWTMNFPGYEGKRVKLLAASLADEKLKITQIQPEGKKPIKIAS